MRGRLLTIELAVKLKKVDLPTPLGFTAANRIGHGAQTAVQSGQLGYAILLAER